MWKPEDIVIHNWPALEQTEDGKWTRAWNVTLFDAPSTDASIRAVERDLSDEEKRVTINKDGRNLCVRVTTDRWGWEDDLYFYSYRMLERINDSIGTIETIQGQARDMWEPWLSRKSG